MLKRKEGEERKRGRRKKPRGGGYYQTLKGLFILRGCKDEEISVASDERSKGSKQHCSKQKQR